MAYRFATAFGVSPRMRLDLFINDMTFKALKNRDVTVYQRHFRRTFIHVRDMVRAFIFALENWDRLVDNVLNVGHESLNYTKEQIMLKIKEKIEYNLDFAEIGFDADQRDYEVSYQKIRSKGFETVLSVDEGVDELLKAYQLISLRNPYSNVED